MLRFLCLLAIFCGVVFGSKPEFGSPHCQQILLEDCSGFSDEPVCASDGKTYLNSCLFAKGICSHHGHSLYAEYDGPC